jgi:hypothetical protein
LYYFYHNVIFKKTIAYFDQAQHESRFFKKLPALRDRKLKCQINQIASLIKVSILKATHRDAECSGVVAHAGTAAVEVEVARVGKDTRTAPVVADGTDTAEQTIAAAAVASHGQFKRRGKSPDFIITDPT